MCARVGSAQWLLIPRHELPEFSPVSEVAATLDRSEAACRQLAARARARP